MSAMHCRSWFNAFRAARMTPPQHLATPATSGINAQVVLVELSAPRPSQTGSRRGMPIEIPSGLPQPC